MVFAWPFLLMFCSPLTMYQIKDSIVSELEEIEKEYARRSNSR